MSRNLNPLHKTLTVSNLITTNNSEYVEIDGYDQLSVNVVIDVDTPAATVSASATDISTADDTFTAAGHDFTTGLKVQVTTSSALPTGISALTDYFVIVVDSDTFALATNLANALAGTKVNITGAGTGNQTVTPVALAGATIKCQLSNEVTDSNSWVDGPIANGTVAAAMAGTAHSITADTAIFFRLADSSAKYFRLVSTSTAGRISYTAYFNGH